MKFSSKCLLEKNLALVQEKSIAKKLRNIFPRKIIYHWSRKNPLPKNLICFLEKQSTTGSVVVAWRWCGGTLAVVWRWVAVRRWSLVWRSCGCGVAVVWRWCGSNMKSVYLNPYIFNVERASADAPRGSMKYQFTYLNIRLFKCGYRTVPSYIEITS